MLTFATWKPAPEGRKDCTFFIARIMKKGYKTALIAAGSILGAWVLILAVLQIVLSPKILTSIVNKYANEYLDAEVSFSSAGLSMFRAFPNASLRLDSCSVTYPSDRFREYIQDPGTLKMARLGTAAGFLGYERDSIPDGTQDTLAVFNRFDVSINPFALLGWKLKISRLNLEKPRIFLHSYSEDQANWNIFGESGASDSTETSFSLPRIVLGTISLSGRPHIVYSSTPDTVSAIMDMKSLTLRGMIDDRLRVTRNVHIVMDSMLVAGRVTADTLIAGVDYLRIDGNRQQVFNTDLNATAFWGSGSFGRLRIPIGLKGRIKVEEDSVMTVDIPHLHASVAHIPFVLNDSRMAFHSDSLYLRLHLNADEVCLDTLLRNYGRQIIMEEAAKLHTDARLSLNADMDGWYVYDPVKYPPLSGSIRIPESRLSYDGIEQDARLELSGKIETDGRNRYNLRFDRIGMAALDSTYLKVKLDIEDLLGEDMLLRINAALRTDLDSIAGLLPAEMGISAAGNMEGRLSGAAYLSQLDMKNICQADLNGSFTADRIYVRDVPDSIDLHIDALNIGLASTGNRDNEDMQSGERVLEMKVSADSIAARYCEAFDIGLSRLALSAQNSAGIISEGKEGKYYPFYGKLSLGKLSLTDSDSTAIRLIGSENSFRITPKKVNPDIPVLHLSSNNRRIFLKSVDGRVGLKNVNLYATAAMNTIERNARKKALLDSLAAVYPDTPRDSLFRKAFAGRQRGEIPKWLSDKDLEKGDINLKLDESLAKYFREWDLSASVGIGSGRLTTPYFPLKTNIADAKMSVTNNDITLKSFCLTSGESDVDLNGEVTGLRRALLGRGPIDLNLKIVASRLNCNELLTAYSVGSNYHPSDQATSLDDATYEKLVAKKAETVQETDSEPSLFIVPANVRATVNLEGYDVSYANMNIDWLNCDITMKERCVQIANTVAAANLGNLFFEGFYSTQTRKDISAGFNLSLMDITAGEVIEMLPQVDTLLPMLKSFDGLLDCEIAGTAALDDNMNILMPTVNGVMRISGKNLSLQQDEDLRKIARILKFRNRREFNIDKMSVEGMVKDSRVEIFPFVLDLDRYRVAMSGVQNLDMSFKYHVSVIKSPIIFKFGVDLYGKDFDHIKFRLGRAKYRNARSIPAFSATIDQTRANLSESIKRIFEKGVAKAVAENEKQAAIESHKTDIDYKPVIDQPLEALSAEEQAKMAEEELELDKPDTDDENNQPQPAAAETETEAE